MLDLFAAAQAANEEAEGCKERVTSETIPTAMPALVLGRMGVLLGGGKLRKPVKFPGLGPIGGEALKREKTLCLLLFLSILWVWGMRRSPVYCTGMQHSICEIAIKSLPEGL